MNARFLVGAICLGLITITGCAGERQADGVLGARDRVAIVEGLAGPESVRYDPDQDVFFVSNFNGESSGDANGFISRVTADGEIESLKFMVGSDDAPLHGPRGMYIVGDTLWAADAAGLHAFNRHTGARLSFVDFTSVDPGFLNDIAQAPDGSLYITDTGRGRLYRLSQGHVEFVTNLPTKPNGITWDETNAYFILAPWDSQRVLAIAPGDSTAHEIGQSPTDRIDGLEFVGSMLLLSSQSDQRIHVIEDGATSVLIDTKDNPADIGIDTKRNRIAVPYVAANRVDIWAL